MTEADWPAWRRTAARMLRAAAYLAAVDIGPA